MTTPVQVPDPTYEQLSDESDAQDVARGAIISLWMHKADWFDGILSGDDTDTEIMQELQVLVDELYLQAHQARVNEDIPDKYAQMQHELADSLAALTAGERGDLND
jgi:hypothetical protein